MLPRAPLTTARILIIDDVPANVKLLERILRQSGYAELCSVTDSRAALPTFVAFQPDLVLLDLHMPYPDGFAVMQHLAAVVSPASYVPIVVLTADITPEAKQRALTLGANDFLSKPFDHVEVLLRIKNLLDTRFLQRQLQQHNSDLESQVRQRTQALEAAQFEVVERLARAAEYRDDVTGEHIRRVAELAARVAQTLGLPAADVELIRRAAPLHDIGKLGIPDKILLKPSKLTAAEFAQMQTHTTIGAQLLAHGTSRLVQVAEQIALTHHERWDGIGYPHGRCGASIPIAGRIVAIADVFDALTSQRPYKAAWSGQQALAEINEQQGRQFDPQVVEAFLEIQASECWNVETLQGYALSRKQ
jgi:putative two-component system response regulator